MGIQDDPAVMNSHISHLGAICFAVAAFTFWVLCDAAIKLAGTSELPSYEITAFLGLFIAMFISAYALLQRDGRKRMVPKNSKRLMLRSFFELGNGLFVVVALRHLSLTLFYIIVFASPMVVVILGRIFLKERFDWRKGAAIAIGFFGVVIAVDPFRPVGASDLIGYAACAVCVCCFSGSIVVSRAISQTEHSEAVVFFSAMVMAGVGLLAMAFRAVPVDVHVLAVLLVMGLLCALGSICLFTALKYAESASTVAQYHYTQLVTGSAVSYFMFGDRPTRFMLIGAVLILASGLYIAVRSKRAGESTSK